MAEGRLKTLFPYGLDAPPVVRNLALAALAFWLLFALSFPDWSPLRISGMIWPALSFSLGAGAMLWSSHAGKLRRRERLLDKLVWHGDERVLDVGCGRGLMAVAAARRVPTGTVVGIDIWQDTDLSGNGADAVAANASREGVAERVSTRTADMRELPFEAASFNVIVSSYAVHNVYQEAGRNQAIDEMVRVLAPSGQVLIDDIRHLPQYATRLAAAGFDVDVERGVRSLFWRLLSFGSLAPGTLLAHRHADQAAS